MFINKKSVDNYLSQYRDLNLTFHCKHYQITLDVHKDKFIVTVYELHEDVPVEQHFYDSWDIATYNFNALSCQYIEKSTKICQEENQVNKTWKHKVR